MARKMSKEEAGRVARMRVRVNRAGRWPKDHIVGEDGKAAEGCCCSGCRRRAEWAVEEQNRRIREMEKIQGRARRLDVGEMKRGEDWGA